MGAFRVLLGSLHYMGLYMQLSLSTTQTGHGEVENHISGNGRCSSNLFSFMSGHQKGRGEDGIGDTICSHAEEELSKAAHRLRLWSVLIICQCVFSLIVCVSIPRELVVSCCQALHGNSLALCNELVNLSFSQCMSIHLISSLPTRFVVLFEFGCSDHLQLYVWKAEYLWMWQPSLMSVRILVFDIIGGVTVCGEAALMTDRILFSVRFAALHQCFSSPPLSWSVGDSSRWSRGDVSC